ncbi:hypothetical protein DRV85_10140 [Rhodosalinus halophilus]|uniref:Uncharacterized protein n=1 Tax=Rhodosalinus halophilus TaxID=2259333 RepID=A0A365U8D8_9RHOB|nr:hypothetical protein [Rhodosalinus halophilus]RBI85015.1 hypothetical protein DRV85_10140 [Rhodosalinus halophilus]
MPDPAGPLLADSVTKLGPEAAGRVVVSGSHGGVYAAALACRSGCRAVILHDAGVGLGEAGIGGLGWLEAEGMAAASVDHASAAIGQAGEMLAQGRISHANAQARACGVRPGMSCTEAARRLEAAPLHDGACPEVSEAREVLRPTGARRALVLVDSASLVRAEDAGQVVVTGSHGAVFGDDPRNALKADAFLALFNDAGGGTGTGRLAALEARGVAAATVAAKSARIGEARSTWQDGIVSAANAPARALGAQCGAPARALIDRALRAPARPGVT